MATDPKEGELAGQEELLLDDIDIGAEPEIKEEPAKAAEDGIELLKKQLADLEVQAKDHERKKEAAERLAKERETEVSRYRNEAQTAQVQVAGSRYQAVVSAIDAVKRDTDLAKREWARAMEVGDFGSAADAQETLSRSAARLEQLEVAKETLEQHANQLRQQAQVAQQEQDRFEQYVGQFTPRQQAWLRQNPEFVTDQKLNKRLLSVYYQAQADDIDANSDEFFDRLNQQALGRPKRVQAAAPPPDEDEGEEVDVTPAPATQPRRAVAAPVSRQAAPTARGNNTPTTIRLTREERELAATFGMTDREWAEQKIAIQKDGSYVRH